VGGECSHEVDRGRPRRPSVRPEGRPESGWVDRVLAFQRAAGNRAAASLIQRAIPDGILDTDDEQEFLRRRKTVRKGQFGGDVAKAQILLEHILTEGPAPPEYHGVEDIGDFTPRFDALVRTFQARTRQAVDGVIGRKTWSMIFLMSDLPDDEDAFLRRRKTVRKGDFGGEVAKAQILIDAILAGPMTPPRLQPMADIGHFTPAFDALVRLFQARTRLDVDGVIGRRTWSMIFLFATLGKARPPAARAAPALPGR
jgi:murein L,D-transpeptidase YcbB/YkuD